VRRGRWCGEAGWWCWRWAGVALAVVTWATRPGTVYTVAQVAAGLAQHPCAWVGRTVTVRGTFAAVVSGNPYGGIGFGSCAGTGYCTMQLPTNVALNFFLVGPTPRGAQAYARMVAALLATPLHDAQTQIIRVDAADGWIRAWSDVVAQNTTPQARIHI
jgi:hypothetical protein